MSYTKAEAKLEIGDSTDLLLGFDVSIRKWKQRTNGELEAYRAGEGCGLCMIIDNRRGFCSSDCPISPCQSLIWS